MRRIAVTGATGFVGRYIVNRLSADGSQLRCWTRAASDRGGFVDSSAIEWVEGGLLDAGSADALVRGCDAVVHAALHHASDGENRSEGEIVEFVEKNIVGTIRLIEAARAAGVPRFVFLSSRAANEIIQTDRPLDELHPLQPKSHYGAHKAAIEKFVHSYGLGEGYAICALRPPGIYGVARPLSKSRWFKVVDAVRRGQDVTCMRGNESVHAEDVARAVEILLAADAEKIAGQVFHCFDIYISDFDVTEIARELCGSGSRVLGQRGTPHGKIETEKLRALGMTFGGRPLLRRTIGEMLDAATAQPAL